MRKMFVCVSITCALLSGLTGCRVRPMITQTFHGPDGNPAVTTFLSQGDTLQWIQAQQAGVTPMYLLITFDGFGQGDPDADPCGLGGQFVVPYDKPFQCKITSPNGLYYYRTSLQPSPPPVPPNPKKCKNCPAKPPGQCPSGCAQVILVHKPPTQAETATAPVYPFVVLCDPQGQLKVQSVDGAIGNIPVDPSQVVSWYAQRGTDLKISEFGGMCKDGGDSRVQGQICTVGNDPPYTYKATLTCSNGTTTTGTAQLVAKPKK
jgi:hypothetical protein